MSRFLKLTNIIINKNYIQNISINKDKFILHILSNNFDGVVMFGSGTFETRDTKIEVCKTKNFSDYKIVTDWIDDGLK